jgi:CelD/BcsL family acetyltransferase involved in cellulose biosynthesis
VRDLLEPKERPRSDDNPSMGPHLGAVRVVAVERLGRHAAAWDQLAELAPLPSPFLRSWWLSATAGPHSRFVLVLRGREERVELLGGLAVDVRRWAGLPVVAPMGPDGLAVDHLDLLARPGWVTEVQAAIRRWLWRPGSRLVDFPGVAATHRLGPVLGSRTQTTDFEEAPWTPLPGDYSAFVKARLPGIMRNSIRRSSNKLNRVGPLRFRVSRPADVDRCLPRLRELHTAQFSPDSGLIREFDAFSAAARLGVARGELQLFELVVGESVVAIDVAFSVGDRFSYYQGGRDTRDSYSGAGTVLMARGIEWASDAGYTEVDFLRGTEPYKQLWAAHSRPLQRLRAGVGPGGLAALGLRKLVDAEATRQIARRVPIPAIGSIRVHRSQR